MWSARSTLTPSPLPQAGEGGFVREVAAGHFPRIS
jgi:hypothetical protein